MLKHRATEGTKHGQARSWTTVDKLRERLDHEVLAGLADDLNSRPSLDEPATRETIEQAIRDGAALIEQHLPCGKGAAPEELERMNAALALYHLYARRYRDDCQNPLSASRECILANLDKLAARRQDAAATEGK